MSVNPNTSTNERTKHSSSTFMVSVRVPSMSNITSCMQSRPLETCRLSVRRACTWTLHCDFRLGEAELLIERRNTRWCRPQNPSDSPVVAHGCFDQGAAYALSPMPLGHDEHRNVTVRHTVAKGAQEA